MDTVQPLLRELLGHVLRRERHAQHRTLAHVAASSGVSIQHLSDVERGRKDPSSEVLAAICGALGLGVAELAARVAYGTGPVRLHLGSTPRTTATDTPVSPGGPVLLDLSAGESEPVSAHPSVRAVDGPQLRLLAA